MNAATRRTTLRGLLAGAAAAALAPATMAAPAGGDDAVAPDAELIRNCAALVAMEREWQSTGPNANGNYPDHPEGYCDLIEKVTETEPFTETGHRAKLSVAVAFYEPDGPDNRSIVDSMLWDAVEALAMPPDKLAQLATQGGEAQT